jgi:hypothetical protein
LPRSAGIAVENNFSRGLVTEATGLTFPENACTETFDCIFRKTGEVRRRKGFDYEASYSLFTLTAARTESAISSYLWKGAGGDGNSSFICVQVGRYIYFYAVNEELSANKHATSIDLDSFDVSGTTLPFSYPVSFAQGDGKLFVVGQFIEPFYVTYTPSTDTISSGTQITIQVRDQKRLVSNVTQRPLATATTVNINHLYNLWNAGWNQSVEVDSGGGADPIQDWDASRGDIPGPGDAWWYYKNTDEDFDLSTIQQRDYAQTETPVGRYIWNAFNVNRPAATFRSNGNDINTQYSRSDQSSLPVDSTDFRPSSVAFFASRVFYAGVNDTGYSTKIYFSQILTSINHAGHCYQEQDPTSETLFDLLPTDGGVIEIPDIANVVFMFESRNSLYVFATNGIWRITGSEGIGFTATDFSINKISSLPNTNNQSFVDLNGVPAWINSEGIWVLQQDETLGSSSVTSLSKDSIQTFFEEIPTESIPYIQGTYNAKERLVYWLYKSTEGSGTDNKYEYDRCLLFNTETGAFYPWKLNTDNDIKVISAATCTGFSSSTTEVDVEVNGDTVVDSGATTVTEDQSVDVAVAGTTKFFCENSSNQVTWSEQYDADYVDWTTAKGTGKNYTSYFITGYKVRGEGIRTQQTSYVRVHSRVEVNSSVQVQGVWDYYTSDGARWSTVQQGYKSKTNGSYSERRLKIRGNGLALQLRFASEAGKPFNVIGWSSLDSVSQVP